MVVVAIVGVLSAVALPQFLGLRAKAQLGAQIGEHIGLAKECSTAIKILGPYPENYPAGTASRNCNDGTTAQAPTQTNIVFTSDPATADSDGAACGPALTLDAATAADDTCEITVDFTNGRISYDAV